MNLNDLLKTREETPNTVIFLRLAGAPKDERFHVKTFEIQEGLSSLWSISLVVTHPDPDLPLDDLIDRGAGLALHKPGARLTQMFDARGGSKHTPEIRVWTGICPSIRHLSTADKGRSFYTIDIVPELWRLSLRRNTRVFQHMSAIDIVIRLLRDWNIEVGKNLVLRNIEKDDYPKFEYRVQYEESDYSFFCRVLEEAGVSFYFDYSNARRIESFEGKGTELTKLVLDAQPHLAAESDEEDDEEEEEDEESDEDEASAEDEEDAADDEAAADEGEKKEKPKKIYGPLPYRGTVPGSLAGDPGEYVANASIARQLRPGAVTLIDHEFRAALGARANGVSLIVDPSEEKPKPLHPFGVPLRVHPTEEANTTEHLYEVVAYAPGVLQHEKSPDNDDNRREGDIVSSGNDPYITRRAENALRAVRNGAQATNFETNALAVAPGTVIKFGGSKGEHPRDELSSMVPQLVLATRLNGDHLGSWRVYCQGVPTAVLKFNEENEAEAIPVPYKPSEVTPKPRIWGVQSAVVVGPKSDVKEQIHCDKYGRVRVQFHWDRQHKYGDPIPKDDADDALGSCWVRVSTPWAGSGYGFVAIPRVGHEVLVSYLEGDPDQPIIVGSVYNGPNPSPYASETVTGIKSKTSPDPKGFNEMYFDDKSGSERIHFQAEKDLSTIVKKTETHSVGATRTTKIGSQDKIHTGQLWELVVGQRETGIQAKSSSAVNDESGGHSGGPSILLQVGGKGGATILLDGGGISVNANAELHMHASGVIHLSAGQAVNIDGAVVNINGNTAHPATVGAFADGPGQPGKKASSPNPGAPHKAGSKGVGGSGMPAGPGPMIADLEFKKAEPDEEEVEDEAVPRGLAAPAADLEGGTLGEVAAPAGGPPAAAGGLSAGQAAVLGVGVNALVKQAITGGDMKAVAGAVGGAVIGQAASTVLPAGAAQAAGALATGALSGGKDGVRSAAAGLVGAAAAAQVVGAATAPAAGAPSFASPLGAAAAQGTFNQTMAGLTTSLGASAARPEVAAVAQFAAATVAGPQLPAGAAPMAPLVMGFITSGGQAPPTGAAVNGVVNGLLTGAVPEATAVTQLAGLVGGPAKLAELASVPGIGGPVGGGG